MAKLPKLDKAVLALFYDGFVRCPNTGVILEILRGDDKVCCPCGKSNPRFPQENAEQTYTHLWRKCDPASAEEFIAQEQRMFEAEDSVWIMPASDEIQ